MLVLFVLFAAGAARYPAEARLVPLVVAVPAVLLAAWQLQRDVRRKPAGAVDSAAVSAEAPIAIMWLAIFVLLVLLGGFVIGGTLAVMASQRYWLRESWTATLVGGVIALGTLTVGFERLLGVVLFDGWLSVWLR
jgi:formate-dependent nitrite reductase membrane component NrfD